jgi:hypothetical protein
MELCDRHGRPELVLIHRAVYTRRANGDRYIRTMQLQCDLQQAEKLRSVAAVLWPPAAEAIEQAIVSAGRESE